MDDLELVLSGETVHLLAERAVYWPAAETLFIADTHWGKAATFRAASIPIPGGTTAADLARLSRVLHRTAARRLVILGDMLHAREGRCVQTFETIARWRGEWDHVEMLLVEGNHDRKAGSPPSDWAIPVCHGPHCEGPFVWQHEPVPHEAGTVLAGHIHPTIRMQGRAKTSARLPCFHLSESVLTLPAFSGFAGGVVIRPQHQDRVFGIVEQSVFECALVAG